jgi:hypothetical protein
MWDLQAFTIIRVIGDMFNVIIVHPKFLAFILLISENFRERFALEDAQSMFFHQNKIQNLIPRESKW